MKKGGGICADGCRECCGRFVFREVSYVSHAGRHTLPCPAVLDGLQKLGFCSRYSIKNRKFYCIIRNKCYRKAH